MRGSRNLSKDCLANNNNKKFKMDHDWLYFKSGPYRNDSYETYKNKLWILPTKHRSFPVCWTCPSSPNPPFSKTLIKSIQTTILVNPDIGLFLKNWSIFNLMAKQNLCSADTGWSLCVAFNIGVIAGGRPGLVVIWDDSYSRSRGFKSQRCNWMDTTFFHMDL